MLLSRTIATAEVETARQGLHEPASGRKRYLNDQQDKNTCSRGESHGNRGNQARLISRMQSSTILVVIDRSAPMSGAASGMVADLDRLGMQKPRRRERTFTAVR
jgi:hypothetical protein